MGCQFEVLVRSLLGIVIFVKGKKHLLGREHRILIGRFESFVGHPATNPISKRFDLEFAILIITRTYQSAKLDTHPRDN